MEFTLLLGIMHCYKGQEYTNIMPAQALTLLRETLVRLLSQENSGEDIFWKGSVCVELRYSRLGKERRQPEVLWKATRPTQVSQDEEGHRAGKGDTNCGETRCPGGTNSFPHWWQSHCSFRLTFLTCKWSYYLFSTWSEESKTLHTQVLNGMCHRLPRALSDLNLPWTETSLGDTCHTELLLGNPNEVKAKKFRNNLRLRMVPLQLLNWESLNLDRQQWLPQSQKEMFTKDNLMGLHSKTNPSITSEI